MTTTADIQKLPPLTGLISLVLAISALEFTQFLLVQPFANLFHELPSEKSQEIGFWLAMGFTRLTQIACIYVVAVKAQISFVPQFKRTFPLNLIIIGSAMLYVIVFTGIYIQTRRGNIEEIQSLSLFLAIQSVIGPLAEELFFRGVIFASLRARIGLISSAVISSLLFAIAHLLGEMPMEWLIMPFAGSFVMSFIYDKGKSLPLCAGLHIIFNVMAILISA